MIVREPYEDTGLIRTYSDAGITILQEQTGIEYDGAVDVPSSPYTYVETELRIGEETPDAKARDEENETGGPQPPEGDVRSHE